MNPSTTAGPTSADCYPERPPDVTALPAGGPSVRGHLRHQAAGWGAPGVLCEFVNPPAGYAAELYLMDANGQNVLPLTSDGWVTADNQWSPDGRRILFRRSAPKLFGSARIRVLTFDDCN